MKVKTFNILKWALFPILLIWEFPQLLIGCFVWVYSKCRKHCIKKKSDDGITYFEVDEKNPAYAVSLSSKFIFVNPNYQDNKDIHHEYGHQIQSLYMGIFYLIFVGIPSGTSNIPWLNKIIRGRKYNTTYNYYHEFSWERRADKFGGVKHIVNEIEESIERKYIDKP